MITAPSAILVICASLRESVVLFLLKGAHFIPPRYGLAARCASRGHNEMVRIAWIAPRAAQARISYEDEPRTFMGEMRKATAYSAANCSGEPNLLVIQ
jgi:hypothetical protein